MPSPSARYQASDQLGIGANSFCPTSRFQTEVHFLVPSSWRSIVTDRPLVLKGRPPACQIMLVAKPGSPVSLVMYSAGSAVCSFLAASMYSSQSLGTAMPCWSNSCLL